MSSSDRPAASAQQFNGTTADRPWYREEHWLARHESLRHPSAHTETIMPARITWLPLATSFDINDNGKLDPRERRSLPDSAFAFPAQRELPLVDADHVRDAIAQLADRKSVSGEGRELAAANIMAAAAHFGLELPDGSQNLVAR